MPDTSGEVNHDDGFMAIAYTSLSFGSEELWERQCANGTDFYELTA
jgi:hypothetical protein